MCIPLLSTPVNEQLVGRLSSSVFQRGKVDVSLPFSGKNSKTSKSFRKEENKKVEKNIYDLSPSSTARSLSVDIHMHKKQRLAKESESSRTLITLTLK